jgi:hypothetical protein
MRQAIGSTHLLLLSSFMPPSPPFLSLHRKSQPVAQNQYQRQRLFLFVAVLLRQHEFYSPVYVVKLDSSRVVTKPWNGRQSCRGSVPIKVLFSILHWCNAYRGTFPSAKCPGRKLLTHLHLAPRLRMRGAILLQPHAPSWSTQF